MGQFEGSQKLLKPMFRWAGSKRKLLPILLENLPIFNRYLEPFAGSACLFFALGPQKAVLSDMNRELIHAYIIVRDNPSEVANALRKMPRSKSHYYHLRSQTTEMMSAADRAARFLYLNRYCFNGVYRTNRKGFFNVPIGVRTGNLPRQDDLELWADALRNARLLSGDFGVCLTEVKKGDFVYLDPPYCKPGTRNRGEYGYDSFSESDLPRLRTWLAEIHKRGANFLLSYRYSTAVKESFSDWNRRTVIAKRHVAGFVSARASVRELLIANYDLHGK